MFRRMLLMLLIRIGKFNMRPRANETPQELANRVRPDVVKGQKVMKLLNPAPSGVELTEIVLGGRPCWHIKPDKPNRKTILMLHGGAYFLGLEHLHHNYSSYAKELAKATGCQVYTPDYRLFPENQMIDMLDDCLAAYQDLRRQGIDPNDVIVSGDSAGGHLALALVLRLKDENIPRPAGTIVLSPGTDLTASGKSFTQRADIDPMLPSEFKDMDRSDLLGDFAIDHPYMSSLNGDYTDFPPLLMFVGGREILYDDTLRVAKKAEKAGVDLTLDIKDHMFHVYPLFAGILPEGKAALEKMSDFIRRVTPLNQK